MDNIQNKFIINEIEAYEVVHLIRAVKLFLKKRTPIYMIDYLKKHEMIDDNLHFRPGSRKQLNSIENKFVELIKKAN